MEREDLQLNRQVDLTHIDAGRHAQHDGCEVKDARDTGSYQAIADILGRGRRRCDDSDGDIEALDDILDLGRAADSMPGDDGADYRWIAVKQGSDGDPGGGEAAVISQGAAEVSGADDQYRPVLGQAEFPGHLVDQVVNVVANAAGAVRTQVRKILA